MVREILSTFQYAYLPSLALVIFFSVLVAVSVWVYRPRSKEIYKRITHDALKD
jgi:cbb3-type cytochrome oxidase subunit 3